MTAEMNSAAESPNYVPPRRLHNPFSLGLSTELLEEPSEYKRAFSERILVSETLQVFQPVNVILTGPQGTGKSMILNLLRYKVLNEFLSADHELPPYLADAPPFLGISINLTRAGFHAFGRRSIARYIQAKDNRNAVDEVIDTDCAADYLVHFLFKEFLLGLSFLNSPRGEPLRRWLNIKMSSTEESVLKSLVEWDCWSGFYSGKFTFASALDRCEKRLNAWRTYLAGNRNFSDEILSTLVPLQDPLHLMGNAIRSFDPERRLSLYVVIDQYEELLGLNPGHASQLQRIINTLIKARDPVVYYKMGVRTFDWGTELRVLGSESKVETQRDYVRIDLADLLVRTESSTPIFSKNRSRWLFAQFAEDVAVRRIQFEGRKDVTGEQVRQMFGEWNASEEANRYFKRSRESELVKRSRLPEDLKMVLLENYSSTLSVLDLHLAIAWCHQRMNRGEPPSKIIEDLRASPWKRVWWRKERIEISLVQLASLAFGRRTLYGWNTILMLSGANITAFLLIFGEVWDYLTKIEQRPLDLQYVPPPAQSDAIYSASRKWFSRDRTDNDGGGERYAVLGRLGRAIRESVLHDRAISNPGHTGFSVRDSDLSKSDNESISRFLNGGVKWAVFEIRSHRSKQRNDTPRHKWYLHPLLSPVLEIPFTRVKEPLYINHIEVVRRWLFSDQPIVFSATGGRNRSAMRKGATTR